MKLDLAKRFLYIRPSYSVGPCPWGSSSPSRTSKNSHTLTYNFLDRILRLEGYTFIPFGVCLDELSDALDG